MGYRVSYNEDEAIGSFTNKMLGENTGFSMGEISILEIPFQEIRTLLVNFLQAEDGIRDTSVTGVQTCALPISAIVERFGRLGILDERLLRYWGGWRPEEPPQPDDPRVIAWVKSCEPRPLVIVDSMIAFHGGDENDAGETRAFMQRCRTIADLGGTAAVIHHDGKSDTAKDYRGSSDFKAAVDAAFHVSNSGPDGRLGIIRLRCFKSRFGFAGEILYHYRGGRFE